VLACFWVCGHVSLDAEIAIAGALVCV